jgi:hypothetical protein
MKIIAIYTSIEHRVRETRRGIPISSKNMLRCYQPVSTNYRNSCSKNIVPTENEITGRVGGGPSFYCRPTAYRFEERNLGKNLRRVVKIPRFDSH